MKRSIRSALLSGPIVFSLLASACTGTVGGSSTQGTGGTSGPSGPGAAGTTGAGTGTAGTTGSGSGGTAATGAGTAGTIGSVTGAGGTTTGATGAAGTTGTGTGTAGTTGTGTGVAGTTGAGTGVAGTTGTGTGTGAAGTTGAGGTTPPPPFEALPSPVAVRKVKNLLVGLPPTDADYATVASSGVAGLQSLINTWTTDSQTVGYFKGKMVTFFRNVFQQSGFSPMDDFKPQLLENGGFDFGPLGTAAVGDDTYARLVQNIQDSFALTAWQTVAEGRPFTDVLTTQRYMMTTALKTVYVQIEMPDDEPYAFGVSGTKLPWSVDMSGTAIPLATSLGNMVFDDEAPATKPGFLLQPTCQGTAGLVNPFTGYAQLFQRLIGFTPRYPFVASPTCWEHPSKPYITAADTSDWQWVTVTAKASTDSYPKTYDVPTMRTLTALPLALPRVGFYTTPAFLALWSTNDSNQHRVTANQTLLVALGQSFTSAASIVPLSEPGLDPSHAVAGTECYGCHKSLDPLRQFWANQLDFNDRNDFPSGGTFSGGAKNPRPTTTGGVLAFGSVNASGANMLALGPLLEQVMDQTDPNQSISRFAIAMTQQLCYFANSAGCLESDPEFRRIALAFQNSSYDFPTLVLQLFSSPLVTNASDTATADEDGVSISIARRDQICAALSNRLGIADICALAVPIPSSTQSATLTIVSSVAADAFSRGSEIPVTPGDPTLFYRAASEMLCENVATQVVDGTAGISVYSSTSTANVTSALTDMVTRIVGYPPTDPHYAAALTILQSHYTAATTGTTKATASNALRSTFALACQSPTSLSFGI
jgi:hypothetical protein